MATKGHKITRKKKKKKIKSKYQKLSRKNLKIRGVHYLWTKRYVDPSSAEKETVDIDILLASRKIDRKIIQ